jgi:hypothetical protein
MGLIAIGGDRDLLQRHRHLRRGDIAQFVKHRQEFPVAGGKADPHAGQVGALGQRLKRDRVGEIRSGAFQHAARRRLGIDFRIAFVAQDHEAEPVGELLEAAEIAAGRHRALRVGRRGDVDRDGSGQRGVVERVEVGQKSIGQRGRQIDRLAPRGAGAGGICRIERIGNQDRRPAAALADIAGCRQRREKQALAAAVQHQKLGFGIDGARQIEPGRKPVRGRAAERFDSLRNGIAAEIGDVVGQNRADKVRHRVLRFAQ